MRRALAALAALLFAAAARAAEAQPFIDGHVHLNEEALQLELLAAHGATRAVVFWGGRSSNASVAEAVRRHPDRLVAFASISPERSSYRAAWAGSAEAAAPLLAELDALLASGAYRGIGEISAVHFPSSGLPGFPEADYSPAAPMMRGILALARRHRVPVLLHIEITRMTELSRLLDDFPDVPVIWAHGGYTPLFIARRMLERHPNLTYELSARTWPEHPRSPDYTLLRDGSAVWPQWLQLIEAMPARFVVGSDGAGRSRSADAARLASVQNLLAQLTPATRARVAWDNLAQLLRWP